MVLGKRTLKKLLSAKKSFFQLYAPKRIFMVYSGIEGRHGQFAI